MATGLKLIFRNAYGEPLDDNVTVRVKHRVLSNRAEVAQHPATKPLKIEGLDSTQGGEYEVSVLSKRYRSVGRFVRVKEGRTTSVEVRLPVRPNRVRSIAAPAYGDLAPELQRILEASDVEEHPGASGAALYDRLSAEQKAGLLNITAKAAATVLPDGRHVLTLVEGLTRVRGDRLFARVNPGLLQDLGACVGPGLFHEVSGSLHTPPQGFECVGAFKTHDDYGNLQLTVFRENGGSSLIADIDIDDAQGIGHVFQVLKNAATRSETHPFDIHEILLAHQQLDPGYRLLV